MFLLSPFSGGRYRSGNLYVLVFRGTGGGSAGGVTQGLTTGCPAHLSDHCSAFEQSGQALWPRSIRSRQAPLALLATLYLGGLRRTEFKKLQLSDHRDERGTVFGKGGRWSIVLLPDPGQEAVAAWIRVRGRKSGAVVCAHSPLRACAYKEDRGRILAGSAGEPLLGHLQPHDL